MPRVMLVLMEATPNTLSTVGEVKNTSLPGAPTISPHTTASIVGGTKFQTQAGRHTYRFTILGDGSCRIQAVDADAGVPIAQPSSYDTTEVHGGHVYVFDVR